MQIHERGAALVMCLQETTGTQAPAVALLEPREPKFWARRTEVIADVFGKGQKLGGHHGTHRMASHVFGASIAGTIAEISGQWGQ